MGCKKARDFVTSDGLQAGEGLCNLVMGCKQVQSESEASFQDVTLRRSSVRRCRVLFSYQPANEDELALQVNDVIEVVGEVEEGWWKGKVNNSVGVFPSNFVMELVDEPAESKRKPRTSSKDEASKLV
uniref:SH3 domain-containing protein n=1 Tax=Timema poppense TaxID=170557 RepID=A0A7R9DD28_TIMPO|nr:unnamed protein product [Timema poppensis]